MVASQIRLSNVSIAGQVTGTPDGDNPYNAGEFYPNGQYAQPTSINDTRKWGAFSADLGFSWDAGNQTILTAFGDSFGFNWNGSSTSGGAGSSTIDSASNGLDLSTLQGNNGDIIRVAGSANTMTASPSIVAVRLTSGYFAYIKVGEATNSTTLNKCKFIIGTGSGPWVCATGNAIKGQDSDWTAAPALTNRSDVGWRSQTLARSTDAALDNGYAIDTMLPLSSAGTAKQIIASAHTVSAHTYIYNTTVACTKIAEAYGFWVFSQTTLTVDLGQWLEIDRSDATRPPGDAYTGEPYKYQVVSVDANAKTFTVGPISSLAPGATINSVKKATNNNTKRPTLNNEDSPIPTGGISIPLGGGHRQYLFFMDVCRFDEAGWFTNYLGIAYSDDYGASWTKASTDATVAASGQNITASNVSTVFTGTQKLSVSNQNLPAGGGVIEIDTSLGIAYLSYATRTTNTLNNVAYISGATGALQGTTSGIRYAMWANNSSYTAYHQQAWPWRPGDGYVYLMTTTNGRYGLWDNGSARMMRVPENDILKIGSYQYFSGFASGVPQWSNDKAAATNIFPDAYCVGEPSFYYHPGTGLYVSTYFEPTYAFRGSVKDSNGNLSNGLVIRTAANPWGPWSDPTTVFLSPDFGYNDIYGGFIHPWSNVGSTSSPTGPNGTVTTSISSGGQSKNDFYFHISLFQPYATYLVKATLTPPTGFLAFM